MSCPKKSRHFYCLLFELLECGKLDRVFHISTAFSFLLLFSFFKCVLNVDNRLLTQPYVLVVALPALMTNVVFPYCKNRLLPLQL